MDNRTGAAQIVDVKSAPKTGPVSNPVEATPALQRLRYFTGVSSEFDQIVHFASFSMAWSSDQ